LNKKILAIIVVVIIIVAAVAAIEALPKSSAKTIKIGLVAPMSTSIGTDMQRAAEMAVKEINDAGGVYVSSWGTNATITLVTADTIDDSPGKAVEPVTKAVTSDKVDMLIGGYGSAGTLADEVVAINNKVPFIITGASNQLVTRRGQQGDFGGFGPNGANSLNTTAQTEGLSYIFHYCTTTYHYTKTVVDFFAQQMKPMVAPNRNFSLAIFYRNDAFGQGVDQATKYWIQNENLPITVVTEQKYDPTTTDYHTQLTTVADAHPDAVFIADNPDKTPLIIEQGWTDVGLKTVYVAVENNQDAVFYNLLGQTGNGQLLESKMDPFMSPSYSTAVQAYSAKFYSKYGVYPGMMGADTYDAFYIAKTAIEAAGTTTKADVRAAIETVNMNQLLIMTQTGKIQFSTGVDYHEIQPITFMEQLIWNTNTSKLESQIVWPATTAGISNFKQADFKLPTGYEPGS
jgi:branched-chain amino acid transport system substrate-binding protein